MIRPKKVIKPFMINNSYPKKLFVTNCIIKQIIGDKQAIIGTNLSCIFLFVNIPKVNNPSNGP